MFSQETEPRMPNLLRSLKQQTHGKTHKTIPVGLCVRAEILLIILHFVSLLIILFALGVVADVC